MLKKAVSKLKRGFEKFRETMVVFCTALTCSCAMRPVTAYAYNSYTAPLDNLRYVMTTIAISLGVIMVFYGIIRFAIAFKSMDQNGEHQALYTLIAGGILTAISSIAAVLGV